MKEFQPFRLDTVNRCLWRGDERLLPTPKAFDVLSYLVEHRARLVTQDEILEAVWTDTHVNPEVVKKAILEIRRILGDRPDRPAFIETLGSGANGGRGRDGLGSAVLMLAMRDQAAYSSRYHSYWLLLARRGRTAARRRCHRLPCPSPKTDPTRTPGSSAR